jgi:hypothetical protein
MTTNTITSTNEAMTTTDTSLNTCLTNTSSKIKFSLNFLI